MSAFVTRSPDPRVGEVHVNDATRQTGCVPLADWLGLEPLRVAACWLCRDCAGRLGSRGWRCPVCGGLDDGDVWRVCLGGWGVFAQRLGPGARDDRAGSVLEGRACQACAESIAAASADAAVVADAPTARRCLELGLTVPYDPHEPD